MARLRTTSRGNDALLDATAATAPKMAVMCGGTVSSFVACTAIMPDCKEYGQLLHCTFRLADQDW